MKGIVHFLTGIALATSIPEVVVLARQGSLLPVLGGIAGLLPDLLDFRFVRYFERYDAEIDPSLDLAVDGSSSLWDVSTETAQAVAETLVDQLVTTMCVAYTTGEPRSLIAHTVRRGADRWRRYTLFFEPETRSVAVRIGPLVETSGEAIPGTDLSDDGWAVRQLDFPLVHEYRREYHVGTFSGPDFCFARAGDGLSVSFLDWHHRWTHSFPLALGVGLLCGSLWSLAFGAEEGQLCGLVTGLAFAGHVLEDQLGHMGCNLFWPFTRHRQPGFGLLNSSDAIPNFLATWTSLAVVLLNLDLAGSAGPPGHLPMVPYLVVALLGPWLLFGTRTLIRRHRHESPAPSHAVLADRELEAELQSGEVGASGSR